LPQDGNFLVLVPSANLGAKKEREKEGESSKEHPFNYYAKNIIDNIA
jgi:hypothetical protein